ncbi:hypothetical protein PQU96_07160 [Vogesella sp. LYT5W]|uniref:Type IV pilus assembly protein PilN n=1 Tax=Vogesella margarita TaxID=2984199 RepID=A0ABT5IN24_9NEIS|nr:hypothetical protein [Vogesella margarita]MDC7713912.1 hypothetical protein [Vogesella margarita]
MRAIDLDYVKTRHHYGRGLLLLLALAALLLQGGYYASLQQEVAGQQQMVARNETALQRLQPRATPAQAPGLQREIARANEVWARLNQSWPQLFDALEAARNKDVALLEVEPDSLRRTVRITAEVKRRPAMLAYIERLGQQPALGDITLLEHHVNQQDKELPIRFSLSAQWRAGS